MSNAFSDAVDILKSARRVTVLTGAGVSKESGVPTYRDALAGLWANYNFEDLASPEGFRRDPAMVWDWYTARRAQLADVQPNPGHVALAALGRRFDQFTLVTQNVDDLHERAGSSDVIHLHGSVLESKCFFDCQGSPTRVTPDQFVVHDQSPPSCPHCGRWLRPDVVWFGEMLPQDKYLRAQHAAVSCDVMLVVGTSGLVYPAASLPLSADIAGAMVIEVNPEPTDISRVAHFCLRGPSGVVLPKLVATLDG
jgi:NAD-dependent deacetylase